MMSASSQLITQRAKQQQRHLLNPLAHFEGSPMALPPKGRMGDKNTPGSKQSRSSGKASGLSNSKSPPQQVLKQISGTIPDNNFGESSKNSDNQDGRQSESPKVFKVDTQIIKMQNKGPTVSLFPKSGESYKRDISQKQSNSASRDMTRQQEPIIKQEETLSESTTSSNNQMQETGNSNHKEVAKQLNQFLENPNSGLPFCNAAQKIIGFVRNKALFSHQRATASNNLVNANTVQSSIIEEGNQQTSSSVPFAHQSKFFELEFKPIQLPITMVSSNSRSGLSAAQKKRRAAAAAQSLSSGNILPNGTRIPDITEWFQSLTINDRVLSMTLIDDLFARSLVEMQTKINRKGHGMFRFQQRVVKGPSLKGTNTTQLSGEEAHVKQDFQYQSIKAIMEANKDQLLMQSKQIHEKEFLDYVRLTYTETGAEPQRPKQVTLNTITVAPSLVAQPAKMLELIQSIVGQNFLKIPLDISMDEITCRFNSRTPVWFDASESNSLAYWIIFYLEISLWIHYLSYVRGQFRVFDQEDSINKMVFIRKEDQQINIKNELGPFWASITSSDSSHKVVREIGTELFNKSQKLNLKPDGSNLSLISQLNGGLQDLAINGKHAENSTRIMEVLINYQEPQKFMTELCMVSLSRIDDFTIYQLNQVFVEILRDRMLSAKTQPSSFNPKNKKKKDKKKQKLQLKRQQILNQNEENSQSEGEPDQSQGQQIPKASTPLRVPYKFTEEEKKEQPRTAQVLSYQSSSHESEEEIAMSQAVESRLEEDFCSNQQLMSRLEKKSPKGERDGRAIDQILSELVFDELPKANHLADIFEQQEKLQPLVQQENHGEQHDDHDSKKDQNQDAKEESKLNTDSQQKKKGQSRKGKGQWRRPGGDNEKDKETSPAITTIQIIRSSKPAAYDEETQASKKIKKKKRSKAVGPATSSQQQKVPSSSVLNSFIRTIIKSDTETEETQETLSDAQNVNKRFKKQGQESDDIIAQKFQRLDSNQIKSQNHQSLIKQHSLITDGSIFNSQDKQGGNTNLVRPMYVKKGTSLASAGLAEEVKVNKHESPATDFRYQSIQTQSIYSGKTSPQPCESRKLLLDKALSVPNIAMRLNSLDVSSSYDNQDSDQSIKDALKTNIQKKKSINNPKRKNLAQTSSKYKKTINQDQTVQPDQYYQSTSQGLHDPNQYLGMPGRTISPAQMTVDHNYVFPQNFDQTQLVKSLIDQMIRSSLPMNGSPQQDFGTGMQGPLYSDFLSQPVVESHIASSIDHNLSEEYYAILDSQMVNLVKETERILDSVRKEREFVINSIQTQVKETFKNAFNQFNLGNSSVVGIKLYGSMASGLAIEQSDVDLAVVGLDLNGNKDLQLQLMKKLCDNLELFKKNYSTIKFIDTATVPVIKLQVDLLKISKNINKHQMGMTGSSDAQVSEINEIMRYLGIDITFEDSSSRVNQGIQCISFIQELCFKQPSLKPIVIVLKKILQKYNLNQPYSGGLNSYSLVLMTSAFLKRFGGEVQSMSKNLQEILNYYGIFFNPQETLINASLDIISAQMLLTDPMTVIDPHNLMNNVTRSAFRIQDIKGIFYLGFEYLITHNNIFRMKHASEESLQGVYIDDVIKRLVTDAI